MPHLENSQPSRNTWGFELGRFVNIPNLGLAIIVAFATSWLSNRDSQTETSFQLREFQRVQEAQAVQLKEMSSAAAGNAQKIAEMQLSLNFMQRQIDKIEKDHAENRGR